MLLESNIVEEDDDSQSGASSQVAKKFKFNWERTIITLLKKQDDKQMSVKRLRKKVIQRYIPNVVICNVQLNITLRFMVCNVFVGFSRVYCH